MSNASSPERWLAHIATCDLCAKAPANSKATDWYSGRIAPHRKGIYERLFTDGIYPQYWNGKTWLSVPNRVAHWRQVGDYPAWRGLKDPA